MTAYRSVRERARSAYAIKLRAAREANELSEDDVAERVHLWTHIADSITGSRWADREPNVTQHSHGCLKTVQYARGELRRLEQLTQGTYDRLKQFPAERTKVFMFLVTCANVDVSEEDLVQALIAERRREIVERAAAVEAMEREQAAELAERVLSGRIDGLSERFAQYGYRVPRLALEMIAERVAA